MGSMVQAHRPRSVKVFEVAPDKKSSIRPTVCVVESAALCPHSFSGARLGAMPQSSRRFTWSRAARPTAAPQDPGAGRFPWSEGFDCIFRNEKVGGSNLPSSTKRPGQSVFLPPSGSIDSRSVSLVLHTRPTGFGAVTSSQPARCFLTTPHINPRAAYWLEPDCFRAQISSSL